MPGLRLVEAPIDQSKALGDDYPFHGLYPIELALAPPVDPSIPEQWFEKEILKSLGFILDMEADHFFPENSIEISFNRGKVQYTQFVHRSGVAFCQIRPGGKGFWFVKNRRLVVNAGYWRNVGAVGPVEIRARVEGFCGDVEKLREFYMLKTSSSV
jgi:hypothetical protein